MRNKLIVIVASLVISHLHGQELSWASRLGGNDADNAYGIKLDTASNVLSTGSFEGTADFDPGSGVTNLVSVGDADVFLSKLDPDGKILWAKQFGGTTEDYGEALAVDADNNFYVTGYFNGTSDFDPGPGNTSLTAAGDYDCFISKLDEDGNLLWARRIGGVAYEQVISIAIDLTGNVVFTGLFNGMVDFDPGAGTNNLVSAGDNDIFVCKLTSSGNFVWAKRMGGTGSDYARGIAIDPSNRIITTGQFSLTADFDPGAGTANLVSAGNTDVFIAVLDDLGNYVWALPYGSLNPDEGTAVYADIDGNIYTTGVFQLTVDFDPGLGSDPLISGGVEDVFITKLSSTGSHVWVKQIGGSALQKTHAITSDVYGNIYTSGYFGGTVDFDPGPDTLNVTSLGNLDVFVSKLNKNGDFMAYSQIGGILADRALDMVVDSSLNILVAGYFNGTCDFDPGVDVFNLQSTGNTDVFVFSLEQCQPTSAELFVSECDLYISPSGQYVWDSSGDYQDTVINADGCDSVLLIHLTILEYTTFTIDVEGCDSFVLPDGTEVTTSGTFEKILVNADGCDSIITFNITIVYSTDESIMVTACESYTSPSGNQEWTEPGIYTDIIFNAVGCDSVITIELEIVVIDASVSQPDITLIADMSGATYQWIDCSNGNQPISGETNQQFTPAEDGFYAVIVSSNNCVDTSECIPYFIDATEYPEKMELLRLYPNPARDYFVIDIEPEISGGRLSVTDNLGLEVLSFLYDGTGKLQVDWAVPAGLYTIALTTHEKRMIGRLVKTD